MNLLSIKSVISFTVLLWISTVSFGQQSPQALFDQANEQLQTGNYEQAIQLYKDIQQGDAVSGALFLNLGISYQRLDSLGRAKYYFMKASRYEETQQQAQQALEHVNAQFSRQSAVLPKLPWDVATEWLQHNIGAENILVIGIILLNIGILLFAAHWFVSWYPNYIRLSGLITSGLAILIIATSFYTRYVSQRYSTAVMITEQVSVLEKPQQNASLISQAYEGYTFTVDHYRSDSHSGWSYVRMSNGLYGWIPNSEILIL